MLTADADSLNPEASTRICRTFKSTVLLIPGISGATLPDSLACSPRRDSVRSFPTIPGAVGPIRVPVVRVPVVRGRLMEELFLTL
jgi:hypothetical protein